MTLAQLANELACEALRVRADEDNSPGQIKLAEMPPWLLPSLAGAAAGGGLGMLGGHALTAATGDPEQDDRKRHRNRLLGGLSGAVLGSAVPLAWGQLGGLKNLAGGGGTSPQTELADRARLLYTQMKTHDPAAYAKAVAKDPTIEKTLSGGSTSSLYNDFSRVLGSSPATSWLTGGRVDVPSAEGTTTHGLTGLLSPGNLHLPAAGAAISGGIRQLSNRLPEDYVSMNLGQARGGMDRLLAAPNAEKGTSSAASSFFNRMKKDDLPHWQAFGQELQNKDLGLPILEKLRGGGSHTVGPLTVRPEDMHQIQKSHGSFSPLEALGKRMGKGDPLTGTGFHRPAPALGAAGPVGPISSSLKGRGMQFANRLLGGSPILGRAAAAYPLAAMLPNLLGTYRSHRDLSQSLQAAGKTFK